jgi:hypothetical protein
VTIYAVSISIEKSIHDDWLMKEVHIPEVMRTSCFTKCDFSRVVEPAGQDEFVKYRIEYLCNSIQGYERYRKEYASALQQEHTRRHAGKFTAARESEGNS